MVLESGKIWKPTRAGGVLMCRGGRLWVTKAGDPADVILGAGDRLELKGRGWLVQALGGDPCDFILSTSLPTGRTPAIPSLSFSKTAR